MKENQKNNENKQTVSEMKNSLKEGEIEDPDAFLVSNPCGFTFDPTDEELINSFLKPKILNQPLPNSRIKTVNLYQYTPQQLFDKYKEKDMYFFTLRDRKFPRGSRASRAAGNGHWFQATGTRTIIGNKDQPIGYKTALVFHEGTTKDSPKTDWLMHEFRIDQKNAPSTTKAQHEMKLDGWVLCRVYKKSKSAKEGKNPGQSNLESPLPVESPPPGLHYVESQRSPHTGENSFPEPEVDQKPLFSVRPLPPGLHNFDHQIFAHTAGCCVPMPCSNQDLLSTGPPPTEMYNTHSWMPGNFGQTCLPKPEQFEFQSINSHMAADNTGESYYPKPPQSQDPLLLNNAHPSGMYNPYSHMPQLPPLSPTIPHPSGTFNSYAQMCGNTGHNYFPMLQTNQGSPLSKRPRLVGMHNICYAGEFLFPEPQSNKDFMPPTRSGTQFTDSQIIADMQLNCYPESLSLPDNEYDFNEVSSYEHHNNLTMEDEEVSSKLARDKPSQHGLQEKDDKQLGS